jgi:hypothetical protein
LGWAFSVKPLAKHLSGMWPAPQLQSLTADRYCDGACGKFK